MLRSESCLGIERLSGYVREGQQPSSLEAMNARLGAMQVSRELHDSQTQREIDSSVDRVM